MNPSAHGWEEQYFIQHTIFLGTLSQNVQNEPIKPYIYIYVYKYHSLVEHSEKSQDITSQE